MADFQVKITTPVELQGAIALEAQLDKDILKAKLLGNDFSALEAQQARVQSAIANASEEAKAGVDKLELSHRELRETIGGVSRAMGGLGEVGLLLSGPTAAVYAVLQVFEKWQEHVKKVHEALVEVIADQNAINATNIQNCAAAARQYADAMADYARHRAAANAADATGDQAMKDRIALYTAQIDAMKQVAAAQEKANEAKIEQDVVSGAISPQEGERRKDAAREALARYQTAEDRQRAEEAIAEHKAELDRAYARQHGLPGQDSNPEQRGALTRSLQQPTINSGNLQHEIDAQNTRLQQQIKDRDDKQAYADKVQAEIDAQHAAGRFTPQHLTEALETRKAEAKTAADMVSATEGLIAGLTERKSVNDNEIAATKAKIETLTKQIEQDDELLRLGQARIDMERRLLETAQAAAGATQAAEHNANVTRQDTSAAQHRQEALHITNVQSALAALENAQRLAEQHQESQQNIADTLHAIHAVMQGMAENSASRQSLEIIAGEVQALGARIQAGTL